MRSIVVLLPAYNEEAAIEPLLDRMRECLDGRPYEVVLVDDGSTDRTAAAAEAMRSALPLTVLRRARNGGLGAAMATGIHHILEQERRRPEPRAAVLITMDADNTQDPAVIPTMIAAIERGADLAIASRFVAGAAAVGVPLYRRVLSGGASVLFRYAIGATNVRDYTCGYRGYRLELIERLAERFQPLIRARGFAVMTELLAKAAADRAVCAEVPLVLRYDKKPGRSKLRLVPTLLEYARVLLLARVDAQRRPIRSGLASRAPGTPRRSEPERVGGRSSG